MQQKLDAGRSEKKALAQQLRETASQKGSSESELKSTHARIAGLRRELGRLKGSREESARKSKELTEAHRELTDAGMKLENTERTLQRQQQQAEATQGYITKLESTNQELEQKLHKQSRSVVELTQREGELQDQLLHKQQSGDEVRHDLKEKNDHLQAKVDEYSRSLSVLRQEHEASQKTMLSETRQRHEASEQLSRENQALMEQVKLLQERQAKSYQEQVHAMAALDARRQLETDQQRAADTQQQVSELISSDNPEAAFEDNMVEAGGVIFEGSSSQSVEEQLRTQLIAAEAEVCEVSTTGEYFFSNRVLREDDPSATIATSSRVSDPVKALPEQTVISLTLSEAPTLPVFRDQHPRTMAELFSFVDHSGIPREYVHIGYPLNGKRSRNITSYSQFGFPEANDGGIQDTLDKIIRDYVPRGQFQLTPLQSKGVHYIYHQAAAFENFVTFPTFKDWFLLSHPEASSNLMAIGNGETSRFSGKKIKQLISQWRSMNVENEHSQFSPYDWLCELAREAHVHPEDPLVQLAGYWTDFSLLMSLKSRVSRYKGLPTPFQWRALYHPQTNTCSP